MEMIEQAFLVVLVGTLLAALLTTWSRARAQVASRRRLQELKLWVPAPPGASDSWLVRRPAWGVKASRTVIGSQR